MKYLWNRRAFLGSAAIAGLGVGLGVNRSVGANEKDSLEKPAILGGSKTKNGAFPAWPVFDQQEEKALIDVLRSGKWGSLNGSRVTQFEKTFTELTGAKHCVATSSGTTALISSLGALEIGPGDEVILPPYTFVATYNAIVNHYALPVFVDTNPETFQIDTAKIEAALTGETKAILPVHIGGSAADMDAILEISKKHKIPVIEDACQAVLGEWRGRKLGNAGLAGCYSFQSSKNLTTGEGGAIITNDEEFADKCYKFHNHNHGKSKAGPSLDRSANYRLSEFQGGILLSQLTRLEAQAKIRDANAAYLTQALTEIPGLKPAKMHDGCTRSSHHLFMMRYDKEQFAKLDRAKFIAAMAKEGISCATGYTPLNKDAYVTALANNRHYQKVYGKDFMAKWAERNRCPVNDKLCAEAVWFTQTTLLGSGEDTEQIIAAIRKIQKHAGDIARS